MKKEDVLKKAQEESSDEMEKFVRDRSAVWMVLAMVISSGFFVCMRSEDEPIMDLAAIDCFSSAVCSIYRFFRLKQPFYLIIGLVLAAMTIFATVRYFQGH